MRFDCIMSRKAKVGITKQLREMNFHNKSQPTIQDIAALLNPNIRGWLNYYGKISRRSLGPVCYYLHHRLIKWVLNKYKRFRASKAKAVNWLRKVYNAQPNLFYHWYAGYKMF